MLVYHNININRKWWFPNIFQRGRSTTNQFKDHKISISSTYSYVISPYHIHIVMLYHHICYNYHHISPYITISYPYLPHFVAGDVAKFRSGEEHPRGGGPRPPASEAPLLQLPRGRPLRRGARRPAQGAWTNRGEPGGPKGDRGGPVENHRKMVVFWENHRKTIGKWWFSGKIIGKP